MKKITLTIGSTKREANANEYPLRYEPKSAKVDAVANGKPTRLSFTNGKGKSVINNHYLYWVEGNVMFYTRTTAAETDLMRKEKVEIIDLVETQAAIPATVGATPQAEEKPAETAKPQRKRVAKA